MSRTDIEKAKAELDALIIRTRMEFAEMIRRLRNGGPDEHFVMPNGEKRVYFVKNNHIRWVQED